MIKLNELLERWRVSRLEYFAEIERCGGVESPYQGYSSLRLARDQTFASAAAIFEATGAWPTSGDSE